MDNVLLFQLGYEKIGKGVPGRRKLVWRNVQGDFRGRQRRQAFRFADQLKARPCCALLDYGERHAGGGCSFDGADTRTAKDDPP